MSKAQSVKPCKAIAAMAMTKSTSPPLSTALAQTIGLRVMVREYLALTVELTVPGLLCGGSSAEAADRVNSV
jgi:hypothetical protein